MQTKVIETYLQYDVLTIKGNQSIFKQSLAFQGEIIGVKKS